MPTAPVDSWGVDRLDPFMEPTEASEIPVNLVAAQTYPKGTVLGELTATPGTFKAYASGNADGSQVPKCILRHSCVTDASGNITYGTGVTAGQGMAGPIAPNKATDAYYSGIFKTQDLAGLDANAMTIMGGKLLSGTLANGIVQFSGA